MKQLSMVLVLAAFSSAAAFGQGSIQFLNNALSRLSLQATNGGGVQAAPLGTVVGVFWGTSSNALTFEPRPVTIDLTPGVFIGATVYGLQGSAPEQSVFLKVAAWYNVEGVTPTTAPQGRRSNGITHYGESEVISVTLGPTSGPGTVIWQGSGGTALNRAKPFTLTPTTEPEMNLFGNNVRIVNEDNTPSAGDHTDFGLANLGLGVIRRTFVIQNTGKDALDLTGVPRVGVLGPHAADFRVTGNPNSPVPPNGTTSFQITFEPTGLGTRMASVSITNSDPDKPSYRFSIQGTANALPPVLSNPGATIVATNGGRGLLTVELRALVNPNGTGTRVTFDYGLTTVYGPSTEHFLPPSATASTFRALVYLTAGYSYHWRVSATNAGGTTLASDATLNLEALSGLPADLNGDRLISQSELDAVYANYVTNSPWLLITNAAGLGTSNVTFTVENSALRNYSVEYSTNLIRWFPLGIPATPRFGFIDTNASTAPQRHYRLRYP